jgi:hypothetical protein
MGWKEHVAFIEEVKNVYNILIEKPERKGQLGRLRHRW